MTEKKVTSIVIVNLPKNLNCFQGGKGVDLSGGSICAIYEDGSFETFSMSREGVKVACDVSKEGPTLATITYGGQSQMFQVHVRKPDIRRFLMINPPEKKAYLAGEKLDLTGIKLLAEYETGERVPYEDIPAVDHTVRFGEAVYPLVIGGLSVPIFIKVTDATLTGIRMGKLPTKTVYLERKEKFDPAGATIIQTYNSGTEQEVPLPYSAVRGFSNLTPGTLTLTVQISQFSTNFQVEIVGKKATRVTIDTPPFRTSYTEGEPIVMDGIRVSVEYNNGESHISDDWEYEPKVAVLGQDLIQVRVGEASAALPIIVAARQLMSIQVCKLPDKTKYKERLEQFEVAGAELKLEYDYGEPEIIPVKAHMVHGFDNRRAGECKVEVQYEGLAAEFSVDILPQSLLGIVVTQMPDKVDYAPGESFDAKGMVVSGFYDSGVMEPLRSYAISPDRPLQLGDVAILLTSVDKTAVVPIKVAEMFRPKMDGPQPWETISQEPQPWKPAEPDPAPAPEFDDAASLFGPGPKPEEKPAEDTSKKSGFWGKKLFGPNTAKYRGEE